MESDVDMHLEVQTVKDLVQELEQEVMPVRTVSSINAIGCLGSTGLLEAPRCPLAALSAIAETASPVAPVTAGAPTIDTVAPGATAASVVTRKDIVIAPTAQASDAPQPAVVSTVTSLTPHAPVAGPRQAAVLSIAPLASTAIAKPKAAIATVGWAAGGKPREARRRVAGPAVIAIGMIDVPVCPKGIARRVVIVGLSRGLPRQEGESEKRRQENSETHVGVGVTSLRPSEAKSGVPMSAHGGHGWQITPAGQRDRCPPLDSPHPPRVSNNQRIFLLGRIRSAPDFALTRYT